MVMALLSTRDCSLTCTRKLEEGETVMIKVSFVHSPRSINLILFNVNMNTLQKEIQRGT